MKNTRKLVEARLSESAKEVVLKSFSRALSDDELSDLQDKMFDLSTNGLMFYNEETCPLPWDAAITEVTGDSITLEGGAGPSGWGKCVVIIPTKNGVIPGGYKMMVEYPDDLEGVISVLTKYGITYDVR